MSALSGHVEDYLRLRRALGFKLEREGRLLGQLVDCRDNAGAAAVTSELTIAWARQPAGAQPNHWAKRLGVVRKFAAYLHTIEPATEVPPPGVFPARRRRPTPYLCRLAPKRTVGAEPFATFGTPDGMLPTAPAAWIPGHTSAVTWRADAGPPRSCRGGARRAGRWAQPARGATWARRP